MCEKIMIWIAWHLPRRLVMWCAIRLHGHATQGPWSSQEVPALLDIEALKRWELETNTLDLLDPEYIRAHFEEGRSLMRESGAQSEEKP